MEKMQKLQLMDKILRELDDLKNSQTSVLKKVTQIETENINLGIPVLIRNCPMYMKILTKGLNMSPTWVKNSRLTGINFPLTISWKNNRLQIAELM